MMEREHVNIPKCGVFSWDIEDCVGNAIRSRIIVELRSPGEHIFSVKNVS